MSDLLLRVDGLEVEFLPRSGRVHAVRGISFDMGPGQAMGLVGESGCGKSVTSQAIMGLVQLPGRIIGGDVRWKGQSLIGPGAEAYRREVCGRDIAMVFQDPMTSLDPLFTVGAQIGEVLVRHVGLSPAAARKRAVELVELVHIREPDKRVDQYPHEFAGGMRQRVLIAMALASEPDLLIADEPTTALDVTVQAGILSLMAELQKNLSLAVLMITHDLGVVARLCQDVAVMYAGEIVEDGPAARMLHQPSHPYTAGLVSATPTLALTHHRLRTIDGQPPDLRVPRAACSFRARCANAVDACSVAPDLIAFDDDGHAIHGEPYVFDVPRNWSLVEALLTHPSVQVQYLFISQGLRAKLLAHAERTLPVDRERVHLVGLGEGAMLALHVAVFRPRLGERGRARAGVDK